MARAAAFCRWELPEDQFEAVEEHLQGCPDCAKAVQALEQAEAPADQPLANGSSPEDFTSQVMARIKGWETAQTWERRRRLVLRGAACFAISLLPIFAFVSHRHPAAPPDTVATVDAVSAHVADMDAATDETVDLGVVEQIDQEFVATLAALELQSLIPDTEAELEAWARREYPADMWLFDILSEQYGYEGTWQGLLRGSGEFLRFDYPLSPGQPNCRPSILALQHMARTAGFTLTLTSVGDIALPEYAWAESPILIRSARLEKTVATAAPGLPPPTPRPVDYSLRIADNSELASSALAHLVISGRVAEGPVAVMSPKWRALLLSDLTAMPLYTGSCGCGPTFTARLRPCSPYARPSIPLDQAISRRLLTYEGHSSRVRQRQHEPRYQMNVHRPLTRFPRDNLGN